MTPRTAARPRVPRLKQMSPARILRTLDFGLMMSIAYPIRREDAEAVAKFLGGAADEAPIGREAFCKADHPIMPAVSQAPPPPPPQPIGTAGARAKPICVFKAPQPRV